MEKFKGNQERKPEFKGPIKDFLLGKVLIKKFGEEALDENAGLILSAMAARAESPDPISGQIEALTEELDSCGSIDELIIVARANGIELTENDLKEARLQPPEY